MPQTVLCDNDIILKLGAMNLLTETCGLLGTSPSHIFVLETARYAFTERRMRMQLEERYSSDGLQRAVDFVRAATPIRDAGGTEDRAVLARVEGVDAGEALLLAAAVDLPDYVLLTGDKRCLRALASDTGAKHIHARLAGRVICFELLMCKLIETVGFARVRESFSHACDCDKVAKVAFGNALQKSQGEVLSTLNVYIRELEDCVGCNWLCKL